jgi:hypothetical protein
MIWCHAALVSDSYYSLHREFYQRARQYAEADEMNGCGEGIMTLSHCQAWILISMYELKMALIPRAWLSIEKASRISLMLGLNRLDGLNHGIKLPIPSPTDWVEKEERRRVFWMAFCLDQSVNIGTGWPMIINEDDVCFFLFPFFRGDCDYF